MKKIILFTSTIVWMLLVISYPVHAETTLKNVVYTSASGKGSLEMGTKDYPYSKFEDAVANVADGGTIYILAGDSSQYGYINVQNPQSAPFIIDKEVTIEPADGAEKASLDCRAAGIMLGADVTFKNIELDFANSYHDHLYANGYHLTLDNVTRYHGAKIVDLVAGGLYDISTGETIGVASGTDAVITIIGENSNFGNLYAGGMNGGYIGNVTLELQDIGSTSVNAIYGCGATEPYVNTDDFFNFEEPDYPSANPTAYPVSGMVNIVLNETAVGSIDGGGAMAGTQVSYSTTYLKSDQILNNISKIVVEKGVVQPKVLTAPEGHNVDVEIKENGTLDLSDYTSFVVNNFTGGGKLIVAQDSLLTICESATGNTSFETNNGVMRQGTYIKMPAWSEAVFTYTPEYDQKGWELKCTQTDLGKCWTAEERDTIYISYWADGVTGTVSIDYEILFPDEVAEGVVALPKPGYHFVKWVDYDTEETVSTEATFIPAWGDAYASGYYYDAYFALNTYRVSFHVNGGEGTMDEQEFTYHTPQTLNRCIFTREGYDFVGWNTKADGTGVAFTDQQEVMNLTSEHEETIILYAQWKNPNAEIGTEDGSGTGGGTEDKGDNSSGIQDFQPNTEFELGKVTNARISEVTYNTVALSWDLYDGASDYEIYRSTKKSSGYKKIATVMRMTYTDKRLKTGKKYYYKVRAVSGDKKSGFSKMLTGKPVLNKPVVKLTKGKRCATLQFTKVKGAQGYEIYRSTKKNKGFKKVVITKKIKYKNKKLKSKKTYYYKVRAYRKVDGKKVYSSYSKVKAVKVK